VHPIVESTCDEPLRTIGALFEPGDIIEIRALNVGRHASGSRCTWSGYFNFENGNDISDALRQVGAEAEGIYVVLNRINPDLLARSSNRLKKAPKNTTSDADILSRRWLYIDVDAKRPAGISANDQEHKAALGKAEDIKQFLVTRSWPQPIVGDSGNGGHLLYRLPVMELQSAGKLVRRVLKALSMKFSDQAVQVDESTGNAARLCKLYGTMTRKGDSTTERPHRRSRLLDTPEKIEAVSLEALESLASEAEDPDPRVPTSQERGSGRRTFDIDRWIAQSGLEVVKGPEAYEGGRKWILSVCPFNAEHEKPAIIELANGALVFNCFHNSCSERDWFSLRRHVNPAYQETVVPSKPANPRITDLSQLPNVFKIESQLQWCIDGMIALGSITLICAESGTGKTWLGYHLAACVASGSPVLGRPVRQSKALYLDGENPLYVVKQRLTDLGHVDATDLIVWGGWNQSPPVGPTDELVINFAREHRGFIVFDSLIEFHPGSEQSSTETRAFMRSFRDLAHLGASVVILHHTGKAESSKQYRGSSDIKAAVDTAYLMSKVNQQSDELGELTLTCFKARLAPGQNFGMRFEKNRGFISSTSSTRLRTTEEVVFEVITENPRTNGKKITDLARERGCSKNQVERCLKSGRWSTDPGPKNSTLYSVPTEHSDENNLGL
jgi:AAA domain